MRHAVAGAAGGLAAGVLLSGIIAGMGAAQGRASELVTLERRTLERPEWLQTSGTAGEEMLAHGGYLVLSAIAGAGYGAVHRGEGSLLTAGLAFGLGFWALAYGAVGPSLGETPKPWRDAPSSLAQHAMLHALFGVATALVVSREQATALAVHGNTGSLLAVQQSFAGRFSGQALLVFPEANSLEFVRAVVGDAVPLADVADMEQEAVAEIGNIVLNGCLATMVNMLRQRLDMPLPEVIRTTDAQLFASDRGDEDNGLVLFLFIDFRVRERDIQGYIALLMDLPSLERLKDLVDDLILRATHAPVPAGQDD